MLFFELSLSSELLAGEGRPGNRLGLDPEDPVGLINWLEDSELFSDSGLKKELVHYEFFDILTHIYSHYGDFQNLAQIYKKNKIESFNLPRENWDKIN